MDKLLELATSSLPAWLILLVVAVWLVAGKELTHRVFNRSERRVERKRAELELARIEFEQEKLNKEAKEAGVRLKLLVDQPEKSQYAEPSMKILKFTSGAVAFIIVFALLPAIAKSIPKDSDRSGLGYFSLFILATAIISIFWPILLRKMVRDEIWYIAIAAITFLGILATVSSLAVIAGGTGFKAFSL